METASFIIANNMLYAYDIGFLSETQYEGLIRVYRLKSGKQTIYDYLGKIFPNEYLTITDAGSSGIYKVIKEKIQLPV